MTNSNVNSSGHILVLNRIISLRHFLKDSSSLFIHQQIEMIVIIEKEAYS
jgi:hypothetical protein